MKPEQSPKQPDYKIKPRDWWIVALCVLFFGDLMAAQAVKDYLSRAKAKKQGEQQ